MPVPMMQDHPRNAILESWYVRAMDRALATLAENFTLRSNAAAPLTTIEVPAGADRSDGLPATISIGGKWRWSEATVTRVHPGGAAGSYWVYAVAAANAIVNVPAPFTDNTNYVFELRIVAAGATPALVPGVVDVYRRVGTLDWDGAKITKLDQEVGDLSQGTGVRNFTVGDGIATSFVLNHGLGTRFVAVAAFRNVAPFDTVDLIEERTDADNVTVRTEGYVPAVNELSVVVVARAAALVQAQIAHAASHLPGGSDPLAIAPLVTALPVVGAANHGMMVRFLADAAAGVEWLLVYRHFQADGVTVNPSALKWEVVGGRPLWSADDTTVTVAVGGYVAQAGAPSIVLPLAGDYDVDIGVRALVSGANGTTNMGIGVNGSVAAGDQGTESAGTQVGQSPGSFSRRKTTLAAAAALSVMLSAVTASGNNTGRWLRVMPVRVG